MILSRPSLTITDKENNNLGANYKEIEDKELISTIVDELKNQKRLVGFKRMNWGRALVVDQF